jgi:hypothetical protein
VPIIRNPQTASDAEAVFYFPGCGSERLFSQVGLATQAMLYHVGVQTVLPPGYLCCGYPQHATGNSDKADKITTDNRVLFHRVANTLNYLDIKTVIVSCGTCMDQLEKYQFEQIFPNARLLDIHEFLLEKNNENEKTEYIDFQKTKLEDDFKFLNKLMFDNKLKLVELKWFKNKNKVGLMSHKDNEQVISISTFYKMTRKQYLSVLAHEMIHAFMVQQNIKDNGDHGRQFTKILNELNRKHPDYDIKPTENAEFFTVNTTQKKPSGMILFHVGKDDYMGILVSDAIINDKSILNKFIDDLKAYIKRTPLNIFKDYKFVNMEFYKCDNPDLLSFKMKRKLSLSDLQFFDITDAMLMKVRDGELFNTVKLK